MKERGDSLKMELLYYHYGISKAMRLSKDNGRAGHLWAGPGDPTRTLEPARFVGASNNRAYDPRHTLQVDSKSKDN